jgi:hypothetical protein
MIEPNGFRVYFSNRRQKSPCGGVLDLDANGADGQRSDPSENIYYSDRRTMKYGTYTLQVNNYNRRSNGVGFEVEIDFDGQVHNIAYDKIMRTGDYVTVAEIEYSKDGFKIIKSLPTSQTARKIWNIQTQTFQKVNVMMLSPNYWDGQGVGNKHYFFMLEDCLDDGQARPFYNEFLKADLDKHRKVMEMVGAKLLTEGTDRQLSGLGFSSTQRNDVLCRVTGAFTRTIKIVF